ncbi:hypothetical protein [Sphingomonas hengshuiensis]|uniref:hypothetical protein n=1 Tax=Sphingomonas hengshuiensis TaxID=1609977 RepID=UPI000AA27642|nr:hypothetical protein [Sphingomonas hengshuiensis]
MKRSEWIAEAAGIAGAAAIAAGCGMIWIPLGVIVAGLLLVTGAILNTALRH